MNAAGESALRVDALPFWLRPFVFLYGVIFGLFLRAILLLFRSTCSISFEGEQLQGPAIYAFWHDRLVLYFMTFHRPQGRQVWMNHPDWYMKPVHFNMLHFMGIERLALGSAGSHGRAALEDVVEALREGASTCITPDGPYGPKYEIKPGVLVMARVSRTPIVCVNFEISRSFRLPTWDRKICPWPFAHVRVRYSAPIHVERRANKDEVLREIQHSLGASD